MGCYGRRCEFTILLIIKDLHCGRITSFVEFRHRLPKTCDFHRPQPQDCIGPRRSDGCAAIAQGGRAAWALHAKARRKTAHDCCLDAHGAAPSGRCFPHLHEDLDPRTLPSLGLRASQARGVFPYRGFLQAGVRPCAPTHGKSATITALFYALKRLPGWHQCSRLTLHGPTI